MWSCRCLPSRLPQEPRACSQAQSSLRPPPRLPLRPPPQEAPWLLRHTRRAPAVRATTEQSACVSQPFLRGAACSSDMRRTAHVPAARPAMPRPLVRQLATTSSPLRPRKAGAKATAGPKPPAEAARPKLRSKPSAAAKPPPSVAIRKAEDALMAQFLKNAETEAPLPLVTSREEFGKKYLFEMITMPVRTPDATFKVRFTDAIFSGAHPR